MSSIQEFISNHASDILTGMAIGGLAITVIETAKAAIEIDKISNDAKENLEDEQNTPEDVKEIKAEAKKQIIKRGVRVAIPLVATCVCVVASNRVSSNKQAALASMVSLSQSAFLEYKDAAKKVIGKEKAEEIEEEVAKERVRKADPTPGFGEEVFCDALTGQVFVDTRAHVVNAWNAVTDDLNLGDTLYLDDFLSCLKGYEWSEMAKGMCWLYDPTNDKRSVSIEFKPFYTNDGILCNRIEYDRYPDSMNW